MSAINEQHAREILIQAFNANMATTRDVKGMPCNPSRSTEYALASAAAIHTDVAEREKYEHGLPLEYAI